LLANNKEEQDWNTNSTPHISEKDVLQAVNKNIKKNRDTEDNALFEAGATEIAHLKEMIMQRQLRSEEEGIDLPLKNLATRLSLSRFEISMILICLAPEMDSKYEKIYAYLQNDITRKKPTMGLILDVLCSSLDEKLNSRFFFMRSRPIFKLNILQYESRRLNIDGGIDSSNHILSCPLKLDEHIVNYLLGHNEIDPQIQDFAVLLKEVGLAFQDVEADDKELTEKKEKIVKIINYWLQYKESQSTEKKPQKNRQNMKEIFPYKLRAPTFYFRAPYGRGKKTLAKSICSLLRLSLLIVDVASAAKSDSNNFEKIISLSLREALLQNSIIYFDNFDTLIKKPKRKYWKLDILAKIPNPSNLIIILSGQTQLRASWFKSYLDSPPIAIELSNISHNMRKKTFILLLKDQKLENEVDFDDLAAKYRFTPGQIKNAVIAAKNIALMRNPDLSTISAWDLNQGCNLQSNERLESLSRRITTEGYQWDDLILPKEKKLELREIIYRIKYKNLVYSKWGFEKKHMMRNGLNILFAGESGTGKTMAAQVIANELKLDLFRIDMASVISNNIGETEKNISCIFKEDETSSPILFFDNADFLFGKRSEVKDPYFGYINFEIDYILQKLDEHNEIVILASNVAKNIDDNFINKMHFRIDFQFPDEESRFRIWKNIFPKPSLLANDVDLKFLAKQFRLTGGNIKNISLNAAFFAAEEAEPQSISMKHIVKATKRELDKIGKPYKRTDFGKYYEFIVNETSG